MSQQVHVIFGAGQIGPRLARQLLDAGHSVRVVRRSPRPVVLDGAEVQGADVIAGDATDPEFAVRAAAGAHVLYHCMNPAYSGAVWERELPRMAGALIDAALASDARLVVLDNLYGYGACEGPRTESTPLSATGKKGRARAQLAEQLEEAARTRALRFVTGRAGDFFGPGAELAVVSPESVRGLAEGRRPIALGNPDATHAFSYVGDVARGLAALGSAQDDVEGQVFHLPVHQVSPTELYAAMGEALGVEVKPRRVARPWFWMAAPFVSMARELLETLYQWEEPFLVDDSRFRSRFPGVGTSFEEAVSDTVAEVAASASAQLAA